MRERFEDRPRLEWNPTRSLIAQVAWFNRLRFWAVLGMLALTVIANVGGFVASSIPLYLMAVLTTLVNLAYVWYFPRLEGMPKERVQRHVQMQMAMDLAVLVMLLHYSGGVTNPMVLFVLFHAFISALLLTLRAALVVSLSALALVTALAFGESFGVLAHHPIRVGWTTMEALDPLRMGAGLATLGLTLGFSVYFTSTIATALRLRESELIRLSRQLARSEKLASVGTLAAGVSHEINNPVGVIQTKAEILRYRIQDGDSKELILADLDTIERHTKRIGAITAGLLAYSRKTPFELRRVDVNELLGEVAELIRVPFKAAGIELSLLRSDMPLLIEGSLNHLLSVLVNILLNARDASPEGSVVTLESRTCLHEAQIRIQDRGVGIEEPMLEKIFDPFFTTKEVDSGTGLGLAISHGIIEKHGGRIEVASELGEGTTFVIFLPCSAPA